MMKIIRLAVIANLIFVFMMGCSGNYGNQKTLSKSDSTVTQQKLIDNWSDYNIWLSYYRGGLVVVVFDPKNDNRKILVEGKWDTVKDQEMLTEIVKANTTSDGDVRLVRATYDWTTGVQEIWGPDNQLYGFIIYQEAAVDWVNVKLVDENTIQLSWQSVAAHPSH
jgi:hypothetical protein